MEVNLSLLRIKKKKEKRNYKLTGGFKYTHIYLNTLSIRQKPVGVDPP
jgi:hypothetical protein